MAYATILLLAVPAYFASGVQRLWAIPTGSHVRFATGFWRAAEYMRVHGKARDIVQDSSFDSHYVMAGLSELRPYVEHMLVYLSQNAHLVDERTDTIDDFMKLGDANAVIATAKKLGIRWFLLHPGHVVRWPAAIVNTPVFEHGGFRVYRFE